MIQNLSSSSFRLGSFELFTDPIPSFSRATLFSTPTFLDLVDSWHFRKIIHTAWYYRHKLKQFQHYYFVIIFIYLFFKNMKKSNIKNEENPQEDLRKRVNVFQISTIYSQKEGHFVFSSLK